MCETDWSPFCLIFFTVFIVSRVFGIKPKALLKLNKGFTSELILETPTTVFPLKYLLWFKVAIVLKLAREHFDKDGDAHLHTYTEIPRRHFWNSLLNYQGNMVHPSFRFDINPMRPRRSFWFEEMPLSSCQPLRTPVPGWPESVLNSRTISPNRTFFPSDENHCEALDSPRRKPSLVVGTSGLCLPSSWLWLMPSGSGLPLGLFSVHRCRDYRWQGFLPSFSPQEEGVLHVFLIPGNNPCSPHPSIWDRKAWPLFISAPPGFAKTSAKKQAQLMWPLLSPSYLVFRVEPWPLSTNPHLLAKQTSSTLVKRHMFYRWLEKPYQGARGSL